MPYFILVRDLGHFVYIVGKINNMLLCVEIMLICACVMYKQGNCDEWILYVENKIIRNL